MSNDRAHVSAHDSAVLNRIFNPNLPYGDVVDEEEVEKELVNKFCMHCTLQ